MKYKYYLRDTKSPRNLEKIFEIKLIINTNLVAKTGSILRVYEATFIEEKYK